MSKIFEDAIADAKKLREVAEENAKKAILEAVTPRIREFIEDQLLEDYTKEADEEMYEDDEETEDSMEEEVVLDESSLNSLIAMLGGEIQTDSLSESSFDSLTASVRAATNNLTEADKQKLLNLADKINESANNLANTNTNKEKPEMEKGEKFYEVDLRALREAVEEEMNVEDPDQKQTTLEEDTNQTDDDLDALINEISLMIDLGDDEDGSLREKLLDNNPNLEGMLVDDEADEDVELSDEEETEELEDEGPELEDEGPELELPGDLESDEDELSEVFDVDPKMLRNEISKIKDAISESTSNNKNLKEAKNTIRQLRRSNRAQTEKLNKYRGAVKTLREQLEDLNLFNAKLLYVNKLLQNKGLTESHKKSIIRALDEAQSLVETKALYKSLTESLSQPKKKLNESTKFGSASRTTTSSSSKDSQTSNEFKRWQNLAGIK